MTTTFTPAFDINPTGTTAALGRNLRLRRLFGADGRTVTVALDQAVPRGVAPRLATIGTTFASIAEGEPDAVTITKGLAGPLLGGDRAPLPWILKASMFSVEFHPTYDATIATVQDAVQVGRRRRRRRYLRRFVQPGRHVRDAHPRRGRGAHLGSPRGVPRLPVRRDVG